MKIGMLITARNKSTRLPLKLLYEIGGKRVIDRVIERCKAVAFVDQVILCTSPHPQDALLAETAFKHGIYYFTGDPEDVLRRLYDAATFFSLDYVLSITADDPFFSVEYANRLANQAKLTAPDYMTVEGLPIGAGLYGIRYEALKTVIEFKHRTDTEIWGYWLNRPDLFDVHLFQAEAGEARDIRLTLDTADDLAFLRSLAEHLSPHGGMSYRSLLSAADRMPAELFVNRHVQQLKPPDAVIEDINERYAKKRELFVAIKEGNYLKQRRNR